MGPPASGWCAKGLWLLDNKAEPPKEGLDRDGELSSLWGES